MRAVAAILMFAAVSVALAVSVAPVAAQTELSFYGGLQGALPSRAHGDDPGGAGAFDFLAAWEGRSLSPPPYFGVRLTWWQNDDWGWAVDFSHNKVYADGATLANNGLVAFAFADGLSIVTVNRYRQWPDLAGAAIPYVGAGIGVSLPHVKFDSGAGNTFGYQPGGPAVALVAGARYPLGNRWSVFGEYKGTYSVNNLDLVSGGELATSIVTNSFNLGASFGF